MYKFLIIVCLFFSGIGMVSAQFVFGVKAGYTSSLGFNKTWSFDANRIDLKSDLAQGMHLGLMLRTGKTFIFQPELLYNIQTVGINVTDSLVSQRQVNLSAIDLPLLIGVKMGRNADFNFRIQFGPKFRFNAGTQAGSFNDGTIVTTTKNWQLGLDAGLGFDIWRFTLDVRYNLMPNMFHYKYINDVELNTSPINSFTLSLGFKLVK
ncbi:MAG: PorT family protein [Prevotellaceae bacterium]|jgi:hypothetical protein|nr:PorT family protein [Prevotellaceae bacterium]